MIRQFLSLFSPRYPETIVYMLQSTEYQIGPYVAWFRRTNNFNKVMHRRSLMQTTASRLLVFAMRLGIAVQVLFGLFVMVYGFTNGYIGLAILGSVLAVAYPVVWAYAITVPLLLGRMFIARPKEKKLVHTSKQIFQDHAAVKIAVVGSYGKTTVKELLLTILSEGKRVAATPANKNVAVSHAQFARKLKGDEEILIIEYGEGKPGDISRFADVTAPDIAFITGVAPAHLDKYKTLEAATDDIMFIVAYVNDPDVYINAESPPLVEHLLDIFKDYSVHGCDGWKVSELQVSVQGMDFVMAKGSRKLKLSTKLVGRHLIGPLAGCVALAANEGLTDEQIIAGVAKTMPFEHRMQPRLLAGGWIIDDTYNGNLEGVRAGLSLLAELDAKRKIYVTPGLVDQGDQAQTVHQEMGQLIAKAAPDQVVLMKNSVTSWIEHGLKQGDYAGKLVIEDDPLNYYTNLDQVIAVGDVVLMQNDWTDNYN